MGVHNAGSIQGTFNFIILDTTELQGDITGLLVHIEKHIQGEDKSSIILFTGNQTFYTTSGYTIFPPNGDLDILHILLDGKKKKKVHENFTNSIEINDLLNLPLPTHPPQLNKLSPKLSDVFKLLLTDLSTEAMENKLFIANSTLKTHIGKVYRIMNVNSRNELNMKYRYIIDEIEALKVIQDDEESTHEQNLDWVCIGQPGP